MKILRLAQVVELTGLPKSTLYRYVKSRQFPSQLKLGERAAGWVEEEVMGWMRSRIDLRDANT